MSAAAAILVLAGALVALVASLGLLRLPTFYQRVHPPTMASTLGVALVVAGSIVRFTALESHLVLHALLVAVFMAITTPVTYTLLVRAALHRESRLGDDQHVDADLREDLPRDASQDG